MYPVGYKGPLSLEYRLARKILAPFGPIVEAIGLILCRHGPQTSASLTLMTGFPSKRVKEGLLILHHHKLVVASNGNVSKNVLVDGNGSAHNSTKQLYTLVLKNLHQRLFFPLWLMYLKNHFRNSDDLSCPSIEVNLMSKVFLHTIVSISNLQADLTVDYSPNSIDIALKRLFHEGFLINTRLSSQNLMQSSHQLDREPVAMDYMNRIGEKRTFPNTSPYSDSKRHKLTSFDEKDFVTFNGKKLRNLTNRFYLEQHFSQRLHLNAGYLIGKLLEECNYSETSADKNGLDDDLELDGSINLSALCEKVDNDISFPIDYSTMPNSPYASNINSETAKNSSTFSLYDPSYLRKGDHTPFSQIKEYILRLVQASQGFLNIRTPVSHESSVIIEYHSSNAKKFLKGILLESFVKERFGPNVFRIFRCIQRHQAVEEKHLSKLVMLDIRETREKLLILLSFGIIQLQDVPRSGDHHPQRTIYLWKYDENFTEDYTLRNVLMKAYCNLYERIAFERGNHALLLSKAEDLAQNRLYSEHSTSPLLSENLISSNHGNVASQGSLPIENENSDKQTTDPFPTYTLSDNEKHQLRELYKKLDQLEWNALQLLPMMALFI